MINTITRLQAFKAMNCFLDDYYTKTLSDDLGSLLGDTQLLADESGTWDSVAWNDWCVALEKKESITPFDAFKGMYNFLKAYYIRTSCSSRDIKETLDKIDISEKKLLSSAVWCFWMECVQKIVHEQE